MSDVIERAELAAAVTAGTVTVVDALPGDYYRQQHLPGAVNLVSADVDRLAGQLLPDKARPIAVYCTNVACSNSHTVAAKLRRLGYADVRTYRGGLEDWVQAGLPVESGDAPAPPTG